MSNRLLKKLHQAQKQVRQDNESVALKRKSKSEHIMNSQRLFFENDSGHQLGARLDTPVDSRPIAYALFAHCFTCTKNLKAIGNISRALTQEHIAVLRFDFTGLGESEGDFAETNFTTNVSDLVSAARFLETRFQAPRILIGHSMGGAAVLQATANITSAAAVATISAPSDPTHLADLLADTAELAEQEGEANVNIGGRTFKIRRQFFEDLEKTRMEETIRNLDRPLLILHSPVDDTVPIDNAARIFQAARHPKSFISLDKADHLLSREEDSLYAGSLIAAWTRKYILAENTREQTSNGDNYTVVVRIGEDRYRTEIIAGGHSLVADEPPEKDGTDLGPRPSEYLLTALGSCIAITLRMYADQKEWPLEAAIVGLERKREDGDDTIQCEIELIGSLDDQQRKRLLAVAGRCPVHRTLKSGIAIENRIRGT
jgi:uncharacterized OsmC-like protein/alpha/beta superfamily hydrolase